MNTEELYFSDELSLIPKQENPSITWDFDLGKKPIIKTKRKKNWSLKEGRKVVAHIPYKLTPKYHQKIAAKIPYYVNLEDILIKPDKPTVANIDHIIDWLNNESDHIIPSLESKLKSDIHDKYLKDLEKQYKVTLKIPELQVNTEPLIISKSSRNIELLVKVPYSEITVDEIPLYLTDSAVFLKYNTHDKLKNVAINIPELTSVVYIMNKAEGQDKPVYQKVSPKLLSANNIEISGMCLEGATYTPERDASIYKNDVGCGLLITGTFSGKDMGQLKEYIKELGSLMNDNSVECSFSKDLLQYVNLRQRFK